MITTKIKEQLPLILGKEEKCKRCNGTGEIPAKRDYGQTITFEGFQICPKCKGTGKLNQEIAIFELALCKHCNGVSATYDGNPQGKVERCFICNKTGIKQPSAKKGDVEELICPACEGIKTINFGIEKGVIIYEESFAKFLIDFQFNKIRVEDFEQAFRFEDADTCMRSIEVIGNIYENPELLKDEE